MGGASRFIKLLTTAPFRPTALILRLSFRLLSTPPTTHHLSTSHFPPIKSFSSPLHTQPTTTTTNTSSISDSHPWPEWSLLINSLQPQDQGIPPEDAFVVYQENELSHEFLLSASALLSFANHNPQLLGMLSRKDIEVVVTNGTPFLFRAAVETARRMRVFLGVNGGNALGADNANTADLMKYILSYASNPTIPSSTTNIYSRELVESSVRNLLQELAVWNSRTSALDQPVEEKTWVQDRYGQTPRHHNQNIVMKRGDWICPKCSFLNFARNNQCLECKEPKKMLTGGEWECPQCDFQNYGRNTVCLRCDCKMPGSLPTNPVNSMSASGYNRDYVYHSSTDHSSSQDDNSKDLSRTTNENFPEVMPLRRGENRFVVSTRKTPLERRQTNTSKGIACGPVGADKSNVDALINRSLDKILGRSSSNSQNGDKCITSDGNSENRFIVSKKKDRSLTSPAYKMNMATEQASSSKYVPFVPFPPGYFSRTEPQQPEGSVSPANSVHNMLTSPQVMQRSAGIDNSSINEDGAGSNKRTENGQISSSSNIISPHQEISSNRYSSHTSHPQNFAQSLPRTDLHKDAYKSLDYARASHGENSLTQNIAPSTNATGTSLHPPPNQNMQSGRTGRSLEGSAVKEPPPLDMSEEAKAERWFKRVAQIKDISELSQIPDEDFPSIMPMRKGVNRFVVSKRKTPMERRLMPSQYRRNLPVERNDPLSKDNGSTETK